MGDSLSFDEALSEVEKILKELSEGDVELEKAVELYERGMKLISYCEEKLKEAKLRVKVLLKDAEGFKLEDFERAVELLKNGKES